MRPLRMPLALVALAALQVSGRLGAPSNVARAQPATPPLEVASARRLPPPALFIAAPDKPAERLGVTRVEIDARVVGHLGETTMTLTFGNSTARALAGDLYVPLPADATVSGYALDVAGQLVDGVVVPKDEARRIFEAEVRKGVDPGLVEWTRGNVFKTRVFPIPARGSRTVRLSWVAPLEQGPNGAVYALPLEFADKLDEARIRVEVLQQDKAPTLEGGEALGLRFDARQVAETRLNGRPLVASLKVALPPEVARPRFMRSTLPAHARGIWFSLRDGAAAPSDLPPLRPKRVQVFWDASRSRATADHARELSVVRGWLEGLGDVEVELTPFRVRTAEPRRYRFPKDASRFSADVGALVYDGGTLLDALTDVRAGPPWADAIVVVTDGISTLGDANPGGLGAPAWIVSSGQTRASATLRALASRNGGAFLDLDRMTDAEAAATLGRPTFSLVGLDVVSGDVEDLTPDVPHPAVGPTDISGRLLSPSATLRLSWGLPGQAPTVTRTHTLTAPREVPEGEVLRFFWAQQRLAALMAEPERNADAMVALGRAHTIVTPGTSLLVLETLEQYLTWDVEPPPTWTEMHARWTEARRERLQIAADTEKSRLDEVAAAWREELVWYAREFDPNPRVRPKPGKSAARGGAMNEEAMDRGAAPPSAAFEAAADEPEPAPREIAAEAKKKDSGDGDDGSGVDATIAISPWDPDVPWTRALKAAPEAERERVYLAQRELHGSAPSFYLDTADFFIGAGDSARGLRVLTNLAELRLDDPALLRILGHRLAQLNELSLAIAVFEQVARLRPEEPQSLRDLALVLGRRALEHGTGAPDLDRALALLAELVKRRWDRFDGIEIISLYEFNRLATLGAKLKLAPLPLDDRFVKSTPLDIRIAMSWDADLTDMDLHVVEPSGEEAYYSNNLTQLGGRVSRDFTQGYGPETYSLRRAMKGTYRIRTKFFSSAAVRLAGAVTLQVDVWTNWSRPGEKRQSMTLRLTESKEEFLVGEIKL
jgi:Ca-activated chloride channel family protein